MPEYNFTVPQVQPVRQSSLADMLTMARGAQAYRQEQQINPLELQAKQMQVEQAAAVNPLELARIGAQSRVATGTEASSIAQAASAAETAATGAASSALNLQANKAKTIANGYVGAINDPMILESAAGKPVDNAKLVDYINNWGQQQAKASGVDPAAANNLIAPYIKMAQENPAGLRNFLIQRHVAGLSESGQLGSYQTSTAVTPEGRTVVSTPTLGGTQTVQVGTAGGVGTAAAPQAGGVTAQQMTGAPLQYPVRTSAKFIPEPGEEEDRISGQTYRNKLISAQTNLSEGRRNVEEVIKQATKLGEEAYIKEGGFFGNLERAARMAIQSAEYDALAKDLAKMHLTNATAMGGAGGTVAGLDMNAVAGGTIKVPPKVLVDIARRVQAQQTEIDMQATGAQKFSRQAGDQNMNKYKQDWSKNADSKVFEAINISKGIEDPKERLKKYNELFPSAGSRKEFLEKYKNLKKLSETGSL
jgi:hypothetical protein